MSQTIGGTLFSQMKIIPKKMRPIAKRKFEDLETAILAYYEEQEQLNNRRKITLRKFYPEWFQYKWQETNNSNYMKHIDGEWKRYYLDDKIIDQPIIDLTTLVLKNWARNKIVSNHMTKKQYYNMAIIIRQSFDYLVELGLQDFEKHPEHIGSPEKR